MFALLQNCFLTQKIPGSYRRAENLSKALAYLEQIFIHKCLLVLQFAKFKSLEQQKQNIFGKHNLRLRKICILLELPKMENKSNQRGEHNVAFKFLEILMRTSGEGGG